MIEIIYFVHGSTLDNESGIATGWNQAPLSARGIRQTQEAALQLEDDMFDTIYVSDLIRAIESAEILFAHRKNEIKIDNRLRECNYGIFTQRPSSELLYEEHIEVPFPNGESLNDVETRIRSFLNEISLSDYKKVAIVGHRVPQLALDVIVLNMSWREAIKNDWRINGHWQPGWCYSYG